MRCARSAAVTRRRAAAVHVSGCGRSTGRSTATAHRPLDSASARWRRPDTVARAAGWPTGLRRLEGLRQAAELAQVNDAGASGRTARNAQRSVRKASATACESRHQPCSHRVFVASWQTTLLMTPKLLKALGRGQQPCPSSCLESSWPLMRLFTRQPLKAVQLDVEVHRGSEASNGDSSGVCGRVALCVASRDCRLLIADCADRRSADPNQQSTLNNKQSH